MSNLLINEPPLQVLPSLAVKIGLNEAMILQQMHYWLIRSTTEGLGEKWVYNSIDEWREQFPFWSRNTIIRAIERLKEMNLVQTAKHIHGSRFNQVTYYKINQVELARISEMDLPNLGKCTSSQEENVDLPNLGKCYIDSKEQENIKDKTLLSSCDDVGESKDKIPYAEIVEAHNRILPMLPAVEKLTPKRKSAIRSCCKLGSRYHEIGFWEAYFSEVKGSAFLTGQDAKWKASFDWLTNSNNLTKVIEGNYK